MNPSPSGAMAPSESVDDVPSLWRRLWATVRDSLRPLAPQPVHADWFSAAEVASYHRAKRSSTTADVIDDATWSDLQVDIYLRHVAVDTSLFGRQALVHRLRSGCAEPARSMGARAAREPATAAVLAAAASARRQLRCVRLDLVPALFDDALPVLPAWADRLWLVPLLLAAGVLLALLHSPLLGALVLMAWALVSAIFVARLSTPLRRWREIRDGLTTLLAAGREMAAAARLAPRPWLTELVDAEAALVAQWRRLAPNAMERLPALVEYLNLVALYDYARMRRQLDAVRADLPDLRASFERIASADADLCLAGHLRDALSWCLAGKGAARQLSLQAMVHPLLAQAQPLSLQLDGQGLLITGHNGVGKSTLLRAVGLNLLAARGLGFCYAAAATVPDLPVMSSIENRDNLQTADSLYMAELRRSADLLKVSAAGAGAVFLVDELFRGTNHVESVSAAGAVLATLARRSLVLVSTHSVVLAPLLRARLRPMCIVRGSPPASLLLEDGVLVEPNGIDIMQDHDLPPGVITAAREIAAWLTAHDAGAQDPPELAS
jgi:hypothetical protein